MQIQGIVQRLIHTCIIQAPELHGLGHITVSGKRPKEGMDMKKGINRVIFAPVIAFFLMLSMVAHAATTNVTGYVEIKGGKYVLLTTNDVYVLEGDEVSSQMIGKEIVVTGSVETKNEVKIISVYIYDEIKK
jgi:hypothetical protein